MSQPDHTAPAPKPLRIQPVAGSREVAMLRHPHRDDWRTCTRVTREHGRTFYFASHLLSPAKRRDMHAAYAYCRVADDLVDAACDLGLDEVEAQLDRWEREVDAPAHPVAIAFSDVRQRYRIPDSPVHDLFRGMRMDLVPQTYATWEDLHRYCYRVAGTIGLISAPILGSADPRALERAVDLGVAMQLTNILRDIAEDAAADRLYLPLEDLQAFVVDPESILAGRPNGAFTDLMRFEIARSRNYYRLAFDGIRDLHVSGQFTTLASSHLYSRILDRIEALDYDVFHHRAAVSTARKLRELPVILRMFVQLRADYR